MGDTSVRCFIRNNFSRLRDESVQLPHVSVCRPNMDTINPSLELLIKEALRASMVSATNPSHESHWLDIVPAPLRGREEDIVNYLGMVVAIDFRHWGERTGSEGCVAEVGEEVKGFTGFYCVASSAVLSEADTKHAEQNVSTEETRTGGNDKSTRMVRGSAAMMFLLRRAVEEHNIPWYDPLYLRGLENEEIALKVLTPCFLGCEEDGVQPMWMPAVKERVSLLLSLGAELRRLETSFYKLLVKSRGYLFSCEESGNGFVDQLRLLHSRYNDVGDLSLPKGVICIPILKLSQLTAVGIINALKAFWLRKEKDTMTIGESCSWLQERYHAVHLSRHGCHHVFFDENNLSLCCDYQIPKALRACHILKYDSDLSHRIDHHVLLAPGSSEEVAIRVGTLVAGEMLLEFLNEHRDELSKRFNINNQVLQQEESELVTKSPIIASNALDYALWFMGRTLSSHHHLCRTIMY